MSLCVQSVGKSVHFHMLLLFSWYLLIFLLHIFGKSPVCNTLQSCSRCSYRHRLWILHTAPDCNLSCPKDGLSRTHLPEEQWAFFSQYHLPEEILKHLGNGRLFCILLVSAYFCRGQALDGPWSCSSAKKIKNGVNALSGLYLISTVPPSKI